jgi:hypothetical protein
VRARKLAVAVVETTADRAVDPILLRSIVRAALAVAASFLIAAALSFDAAGSSRGSRMDRAAGVLGQDETPRPPAPPRVVDGARDQFDWSDAAIGAAGGLGLLLVMVGGQAAWVRRRDDRRNADG